MASGMVSNRDAKKAAKKTKERWRKVLPASAPASGFRVPCQEQDAWPPVPDEEVPTEEARKPNILPNTDYPLWLRFLTQFGAVGIATGGATLMWQHFLVGTICVYASIILIALNFYFAPEFRDSKNSRMWAVIVPMILLVPFTYFWTFRPAPISFEALDGGEGTPRGSDPAHDPQWFHQPYWIVKFHLINDKSDEPYTELRFWLGTDLNIAHVEADGKCSDAAIRPSTQIGSVTLSANGQTIHPPNEEGPSHTLVPGSPVGPHSQWSHSPGTYQPMWDVQCDRIRAGDDMYVNIFVVNLDNKTYDFLDAKKPNYMHVHLFYRSIGNRQREIQKDIPITEPIFFIRN
jgi:hypothetical protein